MQAIRMAGLRLIYEHGYEAMSLRQLAAEVGIQVGSLYNHISTKQELLFDLIKAHMDIVLGKLDEALEGVEGSVDQLRAFTAFHLTYHVVRKREVFIAYSELRSLEPENYEAIVGLRRVYENRLLSILDAGVASGDFVIADTPVASFGILAMLTGVCTWFRPDGRLTTEQLIGIYTDMVLKSTGAVPTRPA